MPLFSWIQRRLDYGRMINAMAHHWSEQSYIVLDMETTGLDVEKDRILSIGWVAIEHGTIALSSARHMYLKGSTVGIHLITDSDIETLGKNPKKVIHQLQRLLSDNLLVAHHAPIEIAFLKKIWQGLDMPETPIRVIDTMAIERVLLNRQHHGIKQNALRLAQCRSRYGLPDYTAHDALTDALSTAELLLGQASHLGSNTSLESLFRLGGQEALLTGKPARTD
jgi:DNA polymerase-3 subunit epsilon